MRKKAFCGLALMGLLLTGCGGEKGGSASNRDNPAGSAATEETSADSCSSLQGFFSELLNLTNAARADVGAPSLKFSFQLGQSAQAYAEDLATQDFFDHKGKDGSTYISRIAATGYRSTALGENLVAGYNTAAGAFSGWMNSDTHRDNLLHKNFTEVGFGMFDATGESTYGRYWVQHLGRPASDSVSDERAFIPNSCGLPVAEADSASMPSAVAARSNVDPSPKPFDPKVLPKSVQTSSKTGVLPVNALATKVASLASQGAAGSASVPEPAMAVGLMALGAVLIRGRSSKR